jgi:hypothetical protein
MMMPGQMDASPCWIIDNWEIFTPLLGGNESGLFT